MFDREMLITSATSSERYRSDKARTRVQVGIPIYDFFSFFTRFLFSAIQASF
jgi:hypothetical protein